MRAGRRTALVACAVAVFYWLTLPPSRLVLDSACRPNDLMTRTSALLHAEPFWQAQDRAASQALQVLAALPAASENAKASQQGGMSAVEQRMTRLSSNELGSSDAQAEAQAKAQRDRLEQMAWLVRCRSAIAERLAGR